MSEHDDGGILSAEQVTALREKAERREAARLRKQKSRVKVATAKKLAAQREAMNAASTPDEFWAISIATFPEEKIAAWKQRQERVLDIIYWIEEMVKGTYDASPDNEEEYVSPEDGNADLNADLAQHGQCDCHGILMLGEFWKNSSRMAVRYVDDRPDSVFAKTGIVTGIPSHWVEKWREFYQGYRLRKAKAEAEASRPTIKCASCQASGDHLAASTIQTYLKSGAPYRCDGCSISIIHREDDMYDGWGRLKDQ